MLHFSDDEFAQRRARLCDAMKNAKLDALLIFAQESMFWLTGYDTFGPMKSLVSVGVLN